MAEDVREVYLISTRRSEDCLFCEHTPEALAHALYEGTVTLCFLHMARLVEQSNVEDGVHLEVVDRAEVPAAFRPLRDDRRPG